MASVRKPPKRVDYLLRDTRDLLLAVVESDYGSGGGVSVIELRTSFLC